MAKKTEKVEDPKSEIEEVDVAIEEVVDIVEETKIDLAPILATKSIAELISIVSAMAVEDRNKISNVVADQMEKFIGR